MQFILRIYLTRTLTIDNCGKSLYGWPTQYLQAIGKIKILYNHIRASPVAQMVKNPPAMQETWVWSLSWEDPLEKGKASHSSILASPGEQTEVYIPWTVQTMGSQRVGHNWAAFTIVESTKQSK